MGIRQSLQDCEGVHRSIHLYQYSSKIVNLLESQAKEIYVSDIFYLFHLCSNYKTFSIYSKYKNYKGSKSVTIAYTHPTSHTNTLNHYNFVLKQIKKLKTKLTPITNFKLSSNKNINKNIIIPVLRKLMAYPITHYY